MGMKGKPYKRHHSKKVKGLAHRGKGEGQRKEIRGARTHQQKLDTKRRREKFYSNLSYKKALLKTGNRAKASKTKEG